MSDRLIESIVNGTLRSLTGLIVTGGGYQLFDGHWDLRGFPHPTQAEPTIRATYRND
jgi:hypothetical protein